MKAPKLLFLLNPETAGIKISNKYSVTWFSCFKTSLGLRKSRILFLNFHRNENKRC